MDTEWVQTDIQGTLFVYERKCEPCYGFLILNRLSANNLIQPITKDIELQDKTPFLLYKTKEILGIWFYEAANCKKLYQIISQVMNKANPDLISTSGPINENGKKMSSMMMTSTNTSGGGGASLVDLLNNAGSKEKSAPGLQGSPSGGEKLLRLLSHPKDQPPPPSAPSGSKPNGDSVAAFFAQVSQSSTVTPMAASAASAASNPLQSLFAKQGAVSLQELEKNDKPMPPLPSHVVLASDLESEVKTKKSPVKKAATATKPITTTPKSSKVKPIVKEENVNGSVSYASVAKTTSQPPQPQQQPQQPPPQIDDKPQLMSPMVFAAMQSSPVVAPAPVVAAPAPVVAPQPLLPPVVPMNGFSSPSKPQITPLTEAQLLQVIIRHFTLCQSFCNLFYLFRLFVICSKQTLRLLANFIKPTLKASMFNSTKKKLNCIAIQMLHAFFDPFLLQNHNIPSSPKLSPFAVY